MRHLRRWGVVVTACYTLVIVFLLLPGAVVIAGGNYLEGLEALFQREELLDGGWIAWPFIALIVAAQATLLFVSVDTRFRRVKRRAHVSLAITTIAFTTALLCFSIYLCVTLALDFDDFLGEEWFWAGVPIGLWCFWAVIFYGYRHGLSRRLDAVVGWLLAGSVLQLLIAVPCHLIVRHRNECSAPAVTGFGIATGVALMLMAFGPSVYFLYRRKLDEYPADG